jgi:TrmH family RNA methyltransferase
MMLTNNKQKLIVSLQQKKFRNEHQLFVIEGIKIISEFVTSTNLVTEIYLSDDSLLSEETHHICQQKGITIELADVKTIERLSTQTTPQHCIALAKIIDVQLNISSLKNEVSIVLDQIQDPGNLGTIIRTADWFGIKNIICSNDTVDCYNYKVVQSSMGSLCNVQVHYVDLDLFLTESREQGLHIYGTLLNGVNYKNIEISKGSCLVFGNEAKGISDKLKQQIQSPITIQRSASTYAESLNVATTVGIVISNL